MSSDAPRKLIPIGIDPKTGQLLKMEKHEEKLLQPTFGFIKNLKLRQLIRSDYSEIYLCSKAKAHKATLILCGSLIEAIMLGMLEPQRKTAEDNYLEIHKKRKLLEDFSLEDLIKSAESLRIIPKDVAKLCDVVRDWRNLVHPSVWIEENIQINEKRANIAIQAVETLIDHLKSTLNIIKETETVVIDRQHHIYVERTKELKKGDIAFGDLRSLDQKFDFYVFDNDNFKKWSDYLSRTYGTVEMSGAKAVLERNNIVSDEYSFEAEKEDTYHLVFNSGPAGYGSRIIWNFKHIPM